MDLGVAGMKEAHPDPMFGLLVPPLVSEGNLVGRAYFFLYFLKSIKAFPDFLPENPPPVATNLTQTRPSNSGKKSKFAISIEYTVTCHMRGRDKQGIFKKNVQFIKSQGMPK